MFKWNSSPHPISDIRDWKQAGRLELRPDFQRLEVWSDPARVMLMDTILRGIPMPKIFVKHTIRDGMTYREVIDGQQRITAILSFLGDQFALKEPYEGDEKNKKFSQLSQDVQNRFLSYQIDFNEALGPSEEEVREVYARVNKYTVPLTKQELRKADFPGDFLQVAEKLAVNSFFENSRIFTPANRRRYGDVEYVSELLAAMIDGIQDKRKTLDDYYRRYMKWEENQKLEIEHRFVKVLNEIKVIFDKSFDISKTRFRNKADFYTLFISINKFVYNGLTVIGKPIDSLQEDLRFLDENIRPESNYEICTEYAIKCVSQANSMSSRRWRHHFISSVLSGTYDSKPDGYASKLFYAINRYIGVDWSGYCPDAVFYCPICDEEVQDVSNKNCRMVWDPSTSVFQITNSYWAHNSCLGKISGWTVLERSYNE